MNKINFYIMGAGNGALATAAHLALLGFNVNMYNRSPEKTKNLSDSKEITLTGEINGVGKINLITDNIEEACKDAHVIMIIIPANGHLFMAEKLAPFLKEGQTIVLSPGRTAGALEVYEYLTSHTDVKDLVVAETQSLIYACRAISDTEVHIFQSKSEVTVGTIPANKTQKVINYLNEAYIDVFVPASNAMETGINNYGAIFHPAPTLLNMSRIESGEEFKYYTQGITSGISNVLEKMDKERIAIGKALNIDTMSTLEWLEVSYAAKSDTIEKAVKLVDAYRGIVSPKSLQVRYIEEDIPYSLVPLESLGLELGVETPTITAIIDLGNAVAKKDFRKIGRTVEKLGLKDKSPVQMIKLINEGKLGGL